MVGVEKAFVGSMEPFRFAGWATTAAESDRAPLKHDCGGIPLPPFSVVHHVLLVAVVVAITTADGRNVMSCACLLEHAEVDLHLRSHIHLLP